VADIVPREALAYLKNKNLKAGFSYKDVWNEEHATAFTVAKAMQLDVLSDLHTAVVDAMEKGQSFESFKKNITPLLQQKGWWGKKEMTDPLTGKTVNAQLGSDRRLKTIYRVNMRSAYQKGQYDRTMASDIHPYLMYRIGPSVNHREDHQSWDGLILPKDDPFWDSHFPPNGWGCKCYTRAVTEVRKKQYEENGIPTAPRLDGTGGGNVPAKTQAPPVKYKTYFNERKGTVEQVPEGVDPAFNWNQGKAARDAGAKAALENAQAKIIEIMSTTMPEEQIAKLNDVGILVTSEKELKQGFENFRKHVENMEEPYKKVYSIYVETTELKHDPLRMVYIGYDPEKDCLFYNKRYLMSPGRQQPANFIFPHELAHRYDCLEIKSWENKEFTDAIEAAIKKLQSNIDRYKDLYNAAGNANPAFQDILSALSDNKIKVDCGHKSEYWAKPNNKALEIFSNANYLQAAHIKLPEFDGLLDDIMEIAKTMFIKGAK
jgi:hypothetical protein